VCGGRFVSGRAPWIGLDGGGWGALISGSACTQENSKLPHGSITFRSDQITISKPPHLRDLPRRKEEPQPPQPPLAAAQQDADAGGAQGGELRPPARGGGWLGLGLEGWGWGLGSKWAVGVGFKC